MTEKFVVVIYGEDNSQKLGLMNVKSGDIEYLPELPENIRITYTEDYTQTYCATSYNQDLCFLAQEYLDSDNYVYSFIKYNDKTKEYSIGMSDITGALCAQLELSDEYSFIRINVFNFSFTDIRGCWVWFELDGFADKRKFAIAVNIETFEVEIIAELEYLAQPYFPHEIVTYVTKDSLVKSRSFARLKLYSREDTSFPIKDLDVSAYHTVLGISDEHRKILWHGVDGDDWQAHIIQTDLVAGIDNSFLLWENGGDFVTSVREGCFIASADASDVVWIGSNVMRWISEGGIAKTFSSLLEFRPITYVSNNTKDIFLNAYDDSAGEPFSIIVHDDGTTTDLRSAHPNSFDIEAMCTWDNTPLSPKRFWTQFNQTEEIIEG